MIVLKRFLHNRKARITALVLSLLIVICIAGFTLSELLGDDVRVKPQSELTYYLDISYDGIDKDKNVSSDSQTANVSSGIINVEDKLPEGLTFKEFVTTGDGSIGAVYRNNKNLSCPGKVVDDGVVDSYNYHGLHYDDATRTVSFQVKGLKAGCVLTVGIKTVTPALDDPDTLEVETRRDFYNFATGSEEDLTVHSNTVHVWMGKDTTSLYDVTYEYEGVIPPNAPVLPNKTSYAEGTSVGVSNDPYLEGYTFSGWKTSDVTVKDGKFTMPNKSVKFVGSFTKKSQYTVTYSIKGNIPEGYIPPSEKSYYEGQNVKIDSFAKGTVFNGYRFKGWTIETEGVSATADNDFTMPNKNVSIVGEFELVTYKVEYKFMGNNIPPNADNYLPDTLEHRPGTSVTLSNVKGEPSGYEFLGWYYDDPFIMPEEDVVIYGEWRIKTGTFEPTITKKIISKKDYYHPGDVVEYEITVTNTAAFTIKNVIVKEENVKAVFKEGTGYTISSPHTVTIASLNSNSSVTIHASYTVTEDDIGTIKNTVKIVGALADNNYYMNPDGSYESSAEFTVQSQLKICKTVDGVGTDRLFMINVSNANGFDTWVRLKKDECQSIYVNPNATYTITETIPQEYSLVSIVRKNTKNETTTAMNGSSFVIEKGINYQVTITNKFKKRGFFHSFGEVVNKIIGNS